MANEQPATAAPAAATTARPIDRCSRRRTRPPPAPCWRAGGSAVCCAGSATDGVQPRDPRVKALWDRAAHAVSCSRGTSGSSDAAPHLAAGTRQAASSAHHGQMVGAAPRVGSPPAAAAAQLREWRRSGGPRHPAAATALSGHAEARGDRATAAVDATAPAVRRACTADAAACDRGDARRALDATRRAVEDASALYRRFTPLAGTLAPARLAQRLVPPVVVELGRLMAVVYRSDKWVGHPRTYIHYMEDPPRLVSDVTGRRLFVVGGSYRVTARGIEG